MRRWLGALCWGSPGLEIGGAVLVLLGVAALGWRYQVIGEVLLGAGILAVLIGAAAARISDRMCDDAAGDLTRFINEVTIIPVSEADYVWLDTESLRQWTAELTGLGFANLGDYTAGAGGSPIRDPNVPQAFARVLAHGQHLCFAEINQSLRPSTERRSVSCTLLSVFASGVQFRTSNAQPVAPGANDLLDIKASYLTGASPAGLLKAHLEQRDRMVSDDGLTVVNDVSLEAYKRYAAESQRRLLQRVDQQLAKELGRPRR